MLYSNVGTLMTEAIFYLLFWFGEKSYEIQLGSFFTRLLHFSCEMCTLALL